MTNNKAIKEEAETKPTSTGYFHVTQNASKIKSEV